MSKKYFVTNFAYGTGPYLRTTQLAIAFNDRLEASGRERHGIIVPLAYGAKQRKIMLEEFGEADRKHPEEILLDRELGEILSRVLFTGREPYEAYLSRWVREVREASGQAEKHLSGRLALTTLAGEKVSVRGRSITLELNRSPRLCYNVAPAYFTSFAYLQDILEHSITAPASEIAVSKHILEKALPQAAWIEDKQNIRCIPFPGTFSFEASYAPRYEGDVIAPPLGPLFKPIHTSVSRGIYITVTGIPGLERLYGEAEKLGIALYSNDTESVSGSAHVLPHIIADRNILFHFARSGWSSVWFSIEAGVPLIVPPFDPTDDPEIYFNNITVEQLGVGAVWRGESLAELLEKAPAIREKQREIRQRVEERFGSWDGIGFSAELFVRKYTGQL